MATLFPLSLALRTPPELRRRIRELVETYSKEAGLLYVPLVRLTVADIYLGRAVGSFMSTGRLTKRVVRINIKQFLEYFGIDPYLADKALRFVVAHEIGHLRTFQDYARRGRVALLYETELQRRADEWAELLTGISRSEFDEAISELRNLRRERIPTIERTLRLQARAEWVDDMLTVTVTDVGIPLGHVIEIAPVSKDGGMARVAGFYARHRHVPHLEARKTTVKFPREYVERAFKLRWIKPNVVDVWLVTTAFCQRIEIKIK